MTIANVALTNTFDEWRTTTNQIVSIINELESNSNLIVFTSNTSSLFISPNVGRGNVVYIEANITSNISDTSTVNFAAANTVNTLNNLIVTLGESTNAWANFIGNRANSYANTTVAAGANAYTDAANTYLKSVISGANTAVGAGANAYTDVANAYVLAVASAAYDLANTLDSGGAIELSTAGFDVANAAFDKANAALANTTTTLNGSLTITTDLVVRGTVNTASANILSQSLTDGTTINWNLAQGQVANVTLGGSRSFANPTNKRVGTYILHVVQGGSGSYTLTWGSDYKWPAGVAPPLTTTVGARDIFSFVSDGQYMYGSFIPDVK